MTTLQEAVATEVVTPGAEIPAELPHAPHRLRRALGAAAATLAFGVVGGGVGLAIAANTDAHLQIAGTNATVETNTHTYDELDIDDTAVQLKKAHDRAVLGQSVGARVNLEVDATKFLDDEGKFDPALVPAYVSLFSDTRQISSDIQWAVEKHDLIGLLMGVGVGVAAYGTRRGYRAWRTAHNEHLGLTPEQVAIARSYHAPERKFLKRTATGLAIASLVSAIPASQMHHEAPTILHPDPLLAGTPLEGVEIDGLIRPAVSYVEQYIEQYIGNTDTYYNQLQKNLATYLANNPVGIPSGPDIVNFGFVTDRHCNIGMDRVIVGLMNAYGIKTLVSGGDDAFSGSFDFESACTSDLAERGKKAKMTLIFTLGNHDDKMIGDDEKKQGIKVLDNNIVTSEGVNFAGNPDERTSRWGQTIQPSSETAQRALTTAQGQKIGEIACKSGKKIVVVLHDPNAGTTALENGCGNAMLALDGHTHHQAGPTDIPLPDGTSGYQFTGASSGGAPGENSSSSPLSHITVGPLNNPAGVNIVSYNRKTGQLIGITEFNFAPDQTITHSQQLTPETEEPSLGALEPIFQRPNSKAVLAALSPGDTK